MLTHDQLCSFLDSEKNEHGLDHIASHGFLCATIVGPQLNDWQNLLFDENASQISSEVLESIEEWRNSIINELKETETITLPILADGEDDTMEIAVDSEMGDWCAGFIEGMYANSDADWFDIAPNYSSDEDEIATLTLPMVIFSGIEEEDPDLADMRNNISIMAEMADAVNKNLSELYLLFHMPTNKE